MVELKQSMYAQFSCVYDLCYWLLGQAVQGTISEKRSAALVKACLRTLQVYLSWIPLEYIFQKDLIENLIKYFISPVPSRNEAIKCFTEIASLTFEECAEGDRNACKERLCMYYCNFISKISETTKGRSLHDEFNAVFRSKSQAGFENFARQVALAISAVLKNNMDLIETATNSMEANEMITMLR